MADLNINIPDCVDDTISAMAKKPAEQIGTTLADIFYIVFGRVNQKAEKRRIKYAHDLKKFKEELEEKENAIDPENKIEPDIQTMGPALESAKYCVGNEELRKMFSNLIVASIDKSKIDYVHPMFPWILSKLSATDAKVLYAVRDSRSNPGILYQISRREIAISIDILKRLGLVDYENAWYQELFQEYEEQEDKKVIVSIEKWENYRNNVLKDTDLFRIRFNKYSVVVVPLIKKHDMESGLSMLEVDNFM